MITNEALRDVRFMCFNSTGIVQFNVELIGEIVTELLALREQTRQHEYPKEKPEENAYVLAFSSRTNGWYHAGYLHETFYTKEGFLLTDVTRFMPLPSAPDAKGGE